MKYVSKDYVIQGSLVDLRDAGRVWNEIDKGVRTSVRKGERMGVKIRLFRTEDLPIVTPFTPNDDDIPAIFEDRHVAYVAEAEDTGEILGWILLAGIGRKLFMLCHASTPEGKRRQTPNLLLWHAIQTHAGGPYEYLDIGASYRSSLRSYFNHFKQHAYPMVMRPIEFHAGITRTPFSAHVYGKPLADPEIGKQWVYERLGTEIVMTFPNLFFAIRTCVAELIDTGRVRKNSSVFVTSSVETDRIPSHLTEATEGVCELTTVYDESVGAVYVFHQLGIPHPEIQAWRKICDERNIPLIEDVSEAWGSHGTGTIGDYCIYDVRQLFPAPYGAFVTGMRIPFERMWNVYACSDLGKEEEIFGIISAWKRPMEDVRSYRSRLWNRYVTNLQSVSEPLFTLRDPVMPSAYPAKFQNNEEAERIAAWLRKFNIQADVWSEQAVVLLPCHQLLSFRHIDYICGAILAQYREGCGLPNG